MDFWTNSHTDRLLTEASIWSADLTCLRTDIQRVDAYVDLYHFDVSDNHFVPGLLFFPDLVAALRPLSRKPFHAHLMVEDPLGLADEFIHAGASLVTVHAADPQKAAACIEHIRALGSGVGLALSLDDPLEGVLPFLSNIDLILMMGTPLGVKGQLLSPQACPRIQRMRELLIRNGAAGKVKIEADGGIRKETVPGLRAAGADCIVMGSLLFKSSDLGSTFSWLHNLPPTDAVQIQER